MYIKVAVLEGRVYMQIIRASKVILMGKKWLLICFADHF